MLVLTPPLGWNSWNTFGSDINENVVMSMADVMVSSGLADCGYKYVVIDDCWSCRERDSQGRLVADPKKFPHGMKYVADYIHSRGLKFGMYNCAGNLTCAGFPGGFEHEYTDAETYAAWGVDYLKYDYCYHPMTIPGDVMYKRMAIALANCGRNILFSACSWGADNTREWIKETGANMWRTTGDINDSWKSVKELCLLAPVSTKYGAINCFPDMDMLINGMHSRGNVGVSGCTDNEYRLHFSMWALLGSPLMIGCDIRSMDEFTRQTLMNREVLAINQDPDYNQAYDASRSALQERNETPVYVRLLANGDLAIGFFNLTDAQTSVYSNSLQLERIGLPESTGRTLLMKELWTGEQVLVRNGIVSFPLEPHSCKLFRCKVVKAQ